MVLGEKLADETLADAITASEDQASEPQLFEGPTPQPLDLARFYRPPIIREQACIRAMALIHLYSISVRVLLPLP